MAYYYIGGTPYNSRQWSIVIVTSILIALSTLAVGLRLYARYTTGGRIHLDDICIVVSLILSYGNCVCEYVGVYFGLGRHAEEVGEKKALRYMLVLYVLQIFWNTTLPMIKVSILLFYKRIFPTLRMKQACNALFVLLGAWYLAFQITAIFQCTPVKFFWERSLPGGHCVDSVSFYIALATTNTFTDLAILLLPMPLVWRLQISRSKKISISAVFLLGGFVCAIALYRITTLPLIDNNDITYSNTYAGIWTSIEGSVGVIVACLPSLMPIWHRLRGRSVGYAQYSRQSNPYGNSSKGFRSTRSTGGGRFTDDDADRFDVFASGKWPVGSQSQERIVQTAVAHGEETYSPTDERNDTSQNAIGVVTEVHQQIELRDLGNVEQLK